MEEIEFIFESTTEAMDNSIEHLGNELKKISTGRATPVMLEGIRVEAYGAQSPLNQVANVNATDSVTLSIKPWDKSMIQAIERAIFEANLGVTPQNDGEVVRITIPPLTKERRQQLVKKAKSLGEDTKVSLRSARRDAMDGIKSAVKDGFPEDQGKRKEQEIEDMTKAYYAKSDKLVETKQKDIMTI